MRNHLARHSRMFSFYQLAPRPLLLGIVTALVLHILSGLSRESSNFLLVALSCIVSTTYDICARVFGIKEGTVRDKRIPNKQDWPFDIRTATEQFELSPDLIHFACCPICFALYPPLSDNMYPTKCTNRRTKMGEECGAQLTRKPESDLGKQTLGPVRCFAYQPLQSWLARFLSRPGMVDTLKSSTPDLDSRPHIVSDILYGDAARQLLAPDGTPFLKCRPGELRLVFNLNIDWFNPYGSRKSGRHYSVGGIYMVCMNLPISLRYQPENVYLAGIIPGPSEPGSDFELNHILRPLVDSLLQLYQPGIIFEKIGIMPSLLVNCALLAVVCDLPGYRKVAGFAGTRSNHMCAFCKLLALDKANFDVNSWPRWTRDELVAAAERWLYSTSKEDREAVFAETGIRWSELMRLPYWNPLRHGVVDAMHNLLLGDAQSHCRSLWKMDRGVAPNKRIAPHSTEQQKDSFAQAVAAIKIGNERRLNNLRRTYLKVIAEDNRVHVPSKKKNKATKAEYASALVQWVSIKLCFYCTVSH